MKNKRRKNILAQTKGYRFDRKKKERVAKEAIKHAGRNAFRDRRRKKGDFRKLFTLRINAAVREMGGISYSKFIDTLKKKNIGLDRKSLAALAKDHPEAFGRLLESIK